MDNKKRKANRILKKLNIEVTSSSSRPKREVVDESKIGVNPFVSNDFQVLVGKKLNQGKYERDGDGDLVESYYDMERDTKTSIYNKSANRLMTMGLSASAMRLFVWITYELDINKDYLWINHVRYMDESGTTLLATYKKAIDELCRYCYIYPMMNHKDVFWINPAIYFNGSRIKKYSDYVVVYEPKTGGDGEF